MKLIKTLDSDNGEIRVFQDDYYQVRRTYDCYYDMIYDSTDFLDNLVVNGFVVSDISIEMDLDDKGIFYYLCVNVRYFL